MGQWSWHAAAENVRPAATRDPLKHNRRKSGPCLGIIYHGLSTIKRDRRKENEGQRDNL